MINIGKKSYHCKQTLLFYKSSESLKKENSTKLKIRLEKKHNRIDLNGRKARHFSETGTLALLVIMEMGQGNQAHAQGQAQTRPYSGFMQGDPNI